MSDIFEVEKILKRKLDSNGQVIIKYNLETNNFWVVSTGFCTFYSCSICWNGLVIRHAKPHGSTLQISLICKKLSMHSKKSKVTTCWVCIIKFTLLCFYLLSIWFFINCFEFLIDKRDGMHLEVCSSAKAFQLWPELVTDFLERRIHFGRQDQSPMQTRPAEIATIPLTLTPMRISCKVLITAWRCFHSFVLICVFFRFFNIIDATNALNKLNYWVEWPLLLQICLCCRFVPTEQCRKKWPRLVQTYLESKIQILRFNRLVQLR